MISCVKIINLNKNALPLFINKKKQFLNQTKMNLDESLSKEFFGEDVTDDDKIKETYLKLVGRLDCGDSSCHWGRKNGGQRTNAGCRCFKDLKQSIRIPIYELLFFLEERYGKKM